MTADAAAPVSARLGGGEGGLVPPPSAQWPLEPAPRLVLFDLDDTLCDYAASREARLQRAFRGDGAPVATSDRLATMVADSIASNPHGSDHFPDLFRRHGFADPARAQAAMAWYRRNRFHALALHGDARSTLAAARSYRGPRGAVVSRGVGIVTNGPADVQRAKLELLGLDGLVDFCVVSGEVGHWKPDARIFAEALRRGGTEAADAVFVGDSAEHDVAGAQGAGIRSIWIDRARGGWAGGLPPDRTISRLGDVLPLLAFEG